MWETTPVFSGPGGALAEIYKMDLVYTGSNTDVKTGEGDDAEPPQKKFRPSAMYTCPDRGSYNFKVHTQMSFSWDESKSQEKVEIR